MNQDISISQTCKLNCLNSHSRGSRDHKTMPLKRFKNRIHEYMSIDDEHWFDAFQKMQNLTEAMEKFKATLNDKILQKRLMYTLNYDRSGQLYKLFKLANENQFNKLSCEDVAMIQNRIDKQRDIRPQAIRDIIKEIFKDSISEFTNILKNILNDQESNDRVNRGDRNARYDRKDARDNHRRPQRQQVEDRREPRRSQVPEQIRDNGLPTVKVNKVEDFKGNFNIYAKIVKINKNFTIGGNNFQKIEFEGGDETGSAVFVVNSLKVVRAGNVIHISNAKIFAFHGQKQIQQQNKNSFLTLMPEMNITVSNKYQLSRRGRGGNRNGGQHKSQASQAESNRTSQRIENRPVRGRARNYDQFDMSIRRGNRGTREDRHEYRRRQEESQQDVEVNVDRSRREIQRKHDRYGDEQDRGRGNRQNRGRGIRGRQDLVDNKEEDRVDRDERPRRRDRRQDQRDRGERINDRNRYNTNWQSDAQEEKKEEELRPKKRQERGRPQTVVSSDQEGGYIKKPEQKGKRVQQIGQGKKKPTKIKDLQPGDENLNIIAQILQISHEVKVNKNCMFCIIGDETGTVWAELPQHHPDVKVNVVLFLQAVDADVHESQRKLIIRLKQDSLVHRTSMKLSTINLDVRMSEQEWQQDSEQQGQQGEQEEGQEEIEQSQEGQVKPEQKKEDPSIIEDF